MRLLIHQFHLFNNRFKKWNVLKKIGQKTQFSPHLSFLSCLRLPSGGASTSPPLVASPPLIVPLFFSSALASCSPGCLLCHLLSCRRLPSACASASHCTAVSHCAPLVSLVWLVVALPLIMAMPPICWCLQLSLHCCLLLCPSCASCPLWLVVM